MRVAVREGKGEEGEWERGGMKSMRCRMSMMGVGEGIEIGARARGRNVPCHRLKYHHRLMIQSGGSYTRKRRTKALRRPVQVQEEWGRGRGDGDGEAEDGEA